MFSDLGLGWFLHREATLCETWSGESRDSAVPTSPPSFVYPTDLLPADIEHQCRLAGGHCLIFLTTSLIMPCSPEHWLTLHQPRVIIGISRGFHCGVYVFIVLCSDWSRYLPVTCTSVTLIHVVIPLKSVDGRSRWEVSGKPDDQWMLHNMLH